MASFSELWAIMESDTPLMGSGEDTEAVTVIRSGRDLRTEDESPFWDDFISLCGNARGLSELFHVAPEQISNWPARIQEILGRLETQDAEDPNIKDDTKMMATGDNGAVTATNVDPNFGEMR